MRRPTKAAFLALLCAIAIGFAAHQGFEQIEEASTEYNAFSYGLFCWHYIGYDSGFVSGTSHERVHRVSHRFFWGRACAEFALYFTVSFIAVLVFPSLVTRLRRDAQRTPA